MDVQLLQQQGSEVPIYPCPTVANVSRPQRCSYDPVALAGRALVVDNGSHSIRAGWAGDDAPSVVFRSTICKPRPKQGQANRAVVGEWGPGLSGWDFGKHTHRYCFESDVPTNFEGQEALMDWALDRLGLTGDCVAHPLLLTEAPLAPSGARNQLSQLLFEAYGVPALSFVAAAPAAFYHHYHMHHRQQQLQQSWMAAGLQIDQQQLLQQDGLLPERFCGSSSGLVICSGHSYTYVVPVYKGQPQWGATMRCWASGAACTAHLQQLLSLHYPLHANGLLGNWQLVEGLKENVCLASADYRQQLKAAAAQPATAGGLAVVVQLPFVQSGGPSKPTPMELAVRAQEAKARGKALADQRRHKVIEEKEEQLSVLMDLRAGAAGNGGLDAAAAAACGVTSLEELDRQLNTLRNEVDRLKGQSATAQATPRPTPPPAAATSAAPVAEAAETIADDATAATATEAAAAAGAAAMEVDATALDPAAAAALAVPVLPAAGHAAAVAAADSAAAGSSLAAAVTNTTNDQGNEADNEYEDEAESDATVSETGDMGLPGRAAAATAAAAAATAHQVHTRAVAAGGGDGADGDSSATVSDDGGLTGTAAAAAVPTAATAAAVAKDTADDDSSATVSDEGLCEQTELMAEVLQQVNQLRREKKQQRKQQRQADKQQLQQQQQPQQQQVPQQQQQYQEQWQQYDQQQQWQQQQQQQQWQQYGQEQYLQYGQQQQQYGHQAVQQQQQAVKPEEINYLGIPDEFLTADQIKIKRRQQLLHAGRMARERQAARKLQEQRERDAMMAKEDVHLASDPFAYLQQLQQRHNTAAARVEARKRRRLGAQPEGGEEVEAAGLVTGRAARRDEKHRQRMRLIAQAAGPGQRKATKDKKRDKKWDKKRDKKHDSKRDKKKGSAADGSESEEGFGDDGADWEVYRAMDMRDSDSDVAAAEEAELNWTSQRLQQIGAAVAAAATATLAAAAAAGGEGAATEPAAAAGEMGDTSMFAAAPAASLPVAAAAAGSSRAVSQEPPDLTAAAAADGAAADGNLMDSAAAAIAGQLCTLAFNPAAAQNPIEGIPPLSEALAGLDLNLLGLGGLGFGEVLGVQQPTKQLTAEDYQLHLGTERVRVPELLMQPTALAGVEQAGLPEVVAVVLKRLPGHVAAAVAAGGVVLTGGNILTPGLVSRIEAELISIRPPDKPMPIYVSRDPLLDTWKGAAALAAATGRTGAAALAAATGRTGAAAAAAVHGLAGSGAGSFLFGDPFDVSAGALNRGMYEECGVDYLKEYRGFKYPDL